MSSYISDLKIALRNMRTKPAFSLMVVGMLALGVAGNAAIFSIFNGLFLRPLPFPEAERVIDLNETAPKWNLQYVGVAIQDFFAWRSHNSTFDGMAGLRAALLNRPELFVSTMTEKLLTYALGRGIEYFDAPTVRAIVGAARRNDYRFESLVLGVVGSRPFQMRRAQAALN